MSSDKWRRIADRLALELEPHAYCDIHSLREEDPAHCPFCSNRRAYLNYLAAGGTDKNPAATMPPDMRSVPLHQVKESDHFCLPGCHCGRNSG